MLERKSGIIAIFARKILLSFMILLTLSSVISLQMQEAYAAVPTLAATSSTGLVAGNSIAINNIVVVFSEPVNATSTDTAALWGVTGFTVASVSTLTAGNCGGSTTLTITVNEDIPTGDIPLVTYTRVGVTDPPKITSCSTNEAMANGTTVTPVDGLIPTMDSATTISTTTIDVTYSEAMDTGGSITAADYTITNPSVTVTGVSVSGSIVTLTVGTMGQDDTPTVAQPGSVNDLSANTLTAPSSVVASDGTANRKNGSGCSGDCQAPTLGVNSEYNRMVTDGFTYNGKPTDVERFYTPYPLITVNVGQQNKAVF